jgi:TolB-like protein
VGKELGVKYVLGGGVRRAGDQVRITVQLADATTGEELWRSRSEEMPEFVACIARRPARLPKPYGQGF